MLARHRFEPGEESDPPSPAAAGAVINEVVAFPAATKQIVITHGAKLLASVPVSAHAPTVHLVSPNGGEARREQITLRWRAHDADGNRLWYTVLYSPDGKEFTPVATALKRTSLRVDLRNLPGGPNARFEVMASDGVLTSSDISDRALKVPMKPPRVSIASPAEQAQFAVIGPSPSLERPLISRTGRCPPLRWCGGPRSTAFSAGALQSRRL